ncbi:MAG: hypothetical protein IT578_11750 [Verrucomicrobiae bacterium]|nr:hypothetical protein [Verrucomicrobiae bacterium]
MLTAGEMLDYVRGGRAEAFAVSPLFTGVLCQGMHRHDWLKTSNDPDTIEGICGIGRDCGFVPFFEVLWFEVGVMDYSEILEEISGHVRRLHKIFRTPHGEYVLVDHFERFHSRHVSKTAFRTLDDLKAYEYVIRRSLDKIEQCRPRLREVIRRTGGRAVPYFTAANPMKCFSLIGDQDRIFLFHDEPDRMLQLCELNEQLSRAAVKIAAEEGFEVFFCGTENSLYSPAMIERYSIPFLVERREWIRRMGRLFYLHECGRMQKLLDTGIYQRLSPDILEGFQPPPSGDITDLAGAVRQLPENVVTKGNLDLNLLLRSKAEEIKDASHALLQGMRGRRHILGGSCSALPGTPPDNFRAMVEAVTEANREA